MRWNAVAGARSELEREVVEQVLSGKNQGRQRSTSLDPFCHVASRSERLRSENYRA